MGYDTIRLKSPYITCFLADEVRSKCKLRQGVDLRTGEVLYQITTQDLEGSFDSRIMVKVDNFEFKNTNIGNSSSVPVLVKTEPYIIVEASVHKVRLGHNCFGSPTDFFESVCWLIHEVEYQLSIELPSVEYWLVKRVDVAEVYLLDTFDSVQEWFRGFNSCSFPRRSVIRYGNTGLYSQGSTTTVKFYHKGIEFVKHDRKRMKRFLSDDKIFRILELANCIIRVEVGVKEKKLQYDYGHTPLVRELDDDYLHRVHDREVTRMLREGSKSMKMVRRSQSVRDRLYSVYASRRAGILLGTWYQLTTLGEDVVKSMMKRDTYYWHIRMLKNAGVSWKATDVILKDFQLVKEDFVPVRSNEKHLVLTLDEAKSMLYNVRMFD